MAAETNPIETTQQIVATTSDDGVSITISVLLFIAFVGLTILTIGVNSEILSLHKLLKILWVLKIWVVLDSGCVPRCDRLLAEEGEREA